MRTDKLKKTLLPNLPYLFAFWVCLKLGTAYRLAAGANFAQKLVGMMAAIGPAFASVNIGGVVIDDFKVVDGKNGVFLGAPSKADPSTRSGYRSTARVTERGLQQRLDALTVDAYGRAVEKLLARAQAVQRPAPIREQMAKAAKTAEKVNAVRPAPDKGKEARDDR